MHNLLEFVKNQQFKTALDLGCGPGQTLVRRFRGAGFTVGFDINFDYISSAKDNLLKNEQKTIPHGSVGFVQGDGTQLPFRDKSFDFVVSRYIIEHIREPERFLNESMRVSRKGGLIIAPSSTWEKFFSFGYHLWLIKVENNQLVFVEKEREVFDEELSQFFHTYRGPLRYISGSDLDSASPRRLRGKVFMEK